MRPQAKFCSFLFLAVERNAERLRGSLGYSEISTPKYFFGIFSQRTTFVPGKRVKSISERSPAWKSLFLPQRITDPIIFSRSLQDQEPTKKPLEGKDFQDGQFHLSEYHRLLLEACQFAKYTSEHPLEKWTVCSLPDLYKSSVEKCHPRRWEFKTPSLS